MVVSSTTTPKRQHNPNFSQILPYHSLKLSILNLCLATTIISLLSSLTTALSSPTTPPTTPPTKTKTPSLIRGNTYGPQNNSTIHTATDVASILNTTPPNSNATVAQWKRAWTLHKRALPLLHTFDACRPPDSSLNLACLWWKAMSGNDRSSPVYDRGLAFDLLPKGSRWIVGRRIVGWYPRLHHANVELRTAFLDGAVTEIVSSLSQNNDQGTMMTTTKTKVRLVSLGAGYDVRSIKFLERGIVDEAVEIDLPIVVEAKKKLLGSKRLLRRRPGLRDRKMPRLVGSDFNDVEGVKEVLREVLLTTAPSSSSSSSSSPKGNQADTTINESSSNNNHYQWHTIFVFEGVMIYLNDGVPSALLNATSSVLRDNGLSGSLCFADRLENVPGGDYDLGVEELKRNGWALKQWLPKPGLARHMGYALLGD